MWLFVDDDAAAEARPKQPQPPQHHTAGSSAAAGVQLVAACAHRSEHAIHLQWRSRRPAPPAAAASCELDAPVAASASVAPLSVAARTPPASPRGGSPAAAAAAAPAAVDPAASASPVRRALSPLLPLSPALAAATAALQNSTGRHSPGNARADAAAMREEHMQSPEPVVAVVTPIVAAGPSPTDEGDAAINFAAQSVPADFQLGFSSGSGKRVQLSSAALKAAEERMRRMQAEDKDEPAHSTAVQKGGSSAHGAAAPADVGSRRPISSERAPLPPPPRLAAEAGAPAGFQLGFTSGSGKRSAVSAAALKAAEARMKLFAAQDEAADAAALLHQPRGGAPDSGGEPHTSRAAPTSAGSMPPLPISAAAIPSDFQLGFSTGKGSRVSISAAALKQAEMKMSVDDEQDGVVAAPSAAAFSPAPAAFKPPGRRSTPNLPLPPIDEERKSQGEPSGSQQQLITSNALLATDDATMRDVSPAKAVPMFSEEALARAKAFMEQNDADSPQRTTGTTAMPMAAPMASYEPAALPMISPERIKQAAALMEQFDAATLSTPVSDAAGAVVDEGAGGSEQPGSKRRKTNFSAALPLPLEEAAEEHAQEEEQQAHTITLQQKQAHTPQQQQPQQPRSVGLSTPRPAPQPASAVSSASAALSASSRKRRGAAFVSPRVTGKPVLTLTSVPTQAPLLTVNRRSPLPGSSVVAAAGAPGSMNHGLAYSLPTTVVSPGARVSLRAFDERCQSALLAMQEQGAMSLAHPPCTNIPVDSINSQNAGQVLFVPPLGAPVSVDAFGSVQATAGWLAVRADLLSLGLSSSLCSPAWVRNQFRWVVWKLACYDRRFGAALPEPACCFRRVVAQCAARFEREFNQVKTPAVKKIMEGDEAAGKFLVLIVAQVVSNKVASGNEEPDDSGIPVRPGGCDIELSDGHYSVWCKLDVALHALLQQGKIREGMKLRIWGASMEGPTPTTPLENTNVYMKIGINGVRHARWDAKLGVQQRCAFLVNMQSLRPDGGPVPAIRVVVGKQYPLVHMHPPTAEDGAPVAQPANGQANGDGASDPPKVRKLHCNQRAHDVRMAAHQKVCEKRMEILRREFEDGQVREKRVPVTADEQAAEEEVWGRQRAELEAELQDLYKQMIPYLKVHLCEVHNRRRDDGSCDTDAPLAWTGHCALFTVWRPVEDHMDLLQPGKELIIYGLSVHARYKPRRGPIDPVAPSSDAQTLPHGAFTASTSHYLQLSTSRLTNIVPRALAKAVSTATTTHAPIPLRHEFMRRPLYLRPQDLWSMPRHAEFDLTCVVLSEQVMDAVGGGRWQRQRRLLCAGMSGDLLLIEVNESKELLFFATSAAVAPMTVMSVENLVYQRFEKQLQLHVATANALTTFKPRGAMPIASKTTLDSSTVSTPVVSHAAFAHPSFSLFQQYLSHPRTAALLGVIDEFSQRIVNGEWNGGQTTTISKEDFATLLLCPISGHVQPQSAIDSIICTTLSSLTPLLLHFEVPSDGHAPPPPPPQPDLLPQSNGDANGTSTTSAGPSTPSLLKRRSSSLLAPGATSKTPASHAHSTAVSHEEAFVAADCATADSVATVCVHPSHVFASLLDAVHWSAELCLDDGAGARWPLQVDAHVFRRLIGISQDSLRDSWLALLRSGDVLFSSATPLSPADSILLSALAQLRRHTFAGIIEQFSMDEPRLVQHLPDFIMLVLSHSVVLPLTSCAGVLSAELSAVCPEWSSALRALRSDAPVTGECAMASPLPLLAADIVRSLSDPDAVRVQLSLTGSQQQQLAADAPVPMEADDGPLEAQHSEQRKKDGPHVDLSIAQLQQLHSRLACAQNGAASLNSHAAASSHPPLFVFTAEEWSALCEELWAAVRALCVAVELAECERFTPPGKPRDGQPLCRSVFIPKRDTIHKI